MNITKFHMANFGYAALISMALACGLIFIANPVFVVLTVLLIIGIWTLTCWRLSKRCWLAENDDHEADRQQIQMEQGIKASLNNLHQISAQELVPLHETVTQLHGVISDATEKLNNSFNGLSQKSTDQQQIMQKVLATFQGVDQDSRQSFSFETFITQINDTLRNYVDILVDVSDRSIESAHKMQDMVAQMDTMFTLIQDVQGLSEQTNLLALNAAIEAARAGQAGRGFAVVAEEVRRVSDHSRELNEQIKDQTRKVKESLSDASQIVGHIASLDMNLAINAKGNMDEMIKRLEHINQFIADSLEASAAISAGIKQDVGSAVTALQYDDTVSQMTTYMEHALINVQQEFNRLKQRMDQGEPVYNLLAEINGALQHLLQEGYAKQRKVVYATSMDEGEIDLF